MSMVAIIPIADMVSANEALADQGFGSNNLSVAAYAGPATTHGALHSWPDAAFEAVVAAIPGVATDISEGDPIARTNALIEAQGAHWGAQAPKLPDEGVIAAGDLYRYDESLWSVIQSFDRSVYGEPPSAYPALIRIVREPGVIASWTQPIDQYDAYRMPNPFNGQPDQCSHNDTTWTTVRDGNIWEPGTSDSGWEEI